MPFSSSASADLRKWTMSSLFSKTSLRGRNVPRERMLEVARHYEHFGGKSPINDQMCELIAALRPELRRTWNPLADLLGKSQLASAAGRYSA